MTDKDQVLADFVREFGPEPDPGVPISIERDRFEEWHNRLRGYRACHAAMEQKWAARPAVKEAASEVLDELPIATVLGQDPFDERDGVRFSSEDWEALNSLLKGDKLYVVSMPVERRIEELTHAVQTLRLAAEYYACDSTYDGNIAREAFDSTAGVVKR